MRQRIAANNKSIDNAGITSDYKQAIAELIWNGFDAKATKINISFTANELGYIAGLTISDNGIGIDLESITNTFGAFLDSQKNALSSELQTLEVKKGKVVFLLLHLQIRHCGEHAILKTGSCYNMISKFKK